MKHVLAFLLAALASSGAYADIDFDFDNIVIDQDDFKSIAEDITAAVNYKALGPAEPLGLTGFGIAGFVSYAPTDDKDAWQRVTGEEVDWVGMAGLSAQKGLPFGIDVGASVAWVPGADVTLYGGEVRYALLEGGVATPAIGVRGTYTTASGIDDFDFDAYGLDISISKGLGPLTPYAGAGYVWSSYDIDSDFVTLDDEDVDESRIFVGLRISALIGITPEYERIGDRDVFNVRLGITF